MAGPTPDLIQTMPRRVLDEVRQVRATLREQGQRLTSLDMAIAQLHGDFAGQSMRIARLEDRLGRIERRLEIGDAWPGWVTPGADRPAGRRCVGLAGRTP